MQRSERYARYCRAPPPWKRSDAQLRLSGEQLDESRQEVRRLGDLTRAGCRQDGLRLLRPEVAGVLVDLNARSQAVQIQFGVELRGVHARADPECLHGAMRRGGQGNGVSRAA